MKHILFLFFFVSLFSFGQSLENFTYLKASGSIPSDFTTLSSKKVEAEYADNDNKDLDKDFFLSTRFFIDELLLSGKVLFNDPVTDYINKVADYVLKDEPTLRKKLRFYTLKTNTPNAFSTDQGVVLVTTGLISQLENEAQLAYILCHEIIHYTESHVQNGYIEQKDMNKGKGDYSGLGYRTRISQLSKYSKDLEFEADKKGIDIYLNSEYSIEEIFTAFEVLMFSYLPFEDIQFDTAFFNTSKMIVPGSFFPDTVVEISDEMDYNDAGQTHPNIQKRIDKAFDHLGEKKSQGEKQYVVSEEDFKQVRNLCRFESINMYLTDREYVQAIYSIYLLRREFPDNRFLDLSFVKAIYGLVKYKNASRFNEVTARLSKIEGESYKLHAFFKNLTKAQLSVIGVRHSHDMAEKYPDDEIFKRYYEDMKKELAVKSQLSPTTLKEMSYEAFVEKMSDTTERFDVEDSIKKVEDSDLSKYEKIRLKRELREMLNVEDPGEKTDANFHLYALWDLVADKELVDELKDIKKEYQDEKERKEEEYYRSYRSSGMFERTEHLGIKKIVVVDPIYEDYNPKDKRNHEKSESRKLNLSEVYEKSFPDLNLQTMLVDSKNLTQSDVDEYNELGLIGQWVGEVVDHNELEMITSTNDQMRELCDKYGTTHFLFSGVYSYKYRNIIRIPKHVFELIAFSVDAETDEIEFMTVRDIYLKGGPRIVKTYIYDILYQLSSEPKAAIEN